MKKRIIKSLLQGGIRKDPQDERDYNFKSFLKQPEEMQKFSSGIPTKVDHTDKMTSVKYQGDLGSCVAFSISAMKEWQEQIEHETEVKGGKRNDRVGKEYNFSEQWIYWNCKKIDPWPNEGGTNFRSALKVLQKIGVPTEKAWPYDELKVGKPESWASMIARWYAIGSYWRIYGLEDAKKALVEGPVVAGIECFEEIYGKLENGLIPYPANPDKTLSYHAVCLVGYDDDKQLLKFKNSWSVFWGDKGYGYIPYSYARDFMWDVWVAKDVKVTKEMLSQPSANLLDGEKVPFGFGEPSIKEGEERKFLMMGFQYHKSLNYFQVVNKIFSIPAEDIYREAAINGIDASKPSDVNDFCKKYFADFRKIGRQNTGLEVDALMPGDDCVESNPILGISLFEDEVDQDKRNLKFNLNNIISKVRKIKGINEGTQMIYEGFRKY